LELRQGLRHQKTRLPGLSYGTVCVILFDRFGTTIPACDIQTETNTRWQHVPL